MPFCNLYMGRPSYLYVLTWHADSGQLHVTIEPGGTSLKLRATTHSCYVIRCVLPGRILGQTNIMVLINISAKELLSSDILVTNSKTNTQMIDVG